ncbi:MAG: D-alanyl-D-alanine carboxypeptidase, partial [Alphaproteobacteria bacterium]|nr:D-alanyl-D-alanine carboxypeptidase [Alphaproteobacteria bacterium]
QLFRANVPVETANVWLGRQAQLPLMLDQPLERVLSRTERARMRITVNWQDPVPAPIVKGDKIGTLTFKTDGITETYDLLAGESVGQLGMFERVGAAVKYLIFGAAQPLQN